MSAAPNPAVLGSSGALKPLLSGVLDVAQERAALRPEGARSRARSSLMPGSIRVDAA